MASLNKLGVFVKTPDFQGNRAAKNEYWNAETKKWIEGCYFPDWAGGRYVSGIHYFYLTCCMLLQGDGSRIRPLYRDCDAKFIDAYLECISEKKDLLVVKWRGFGLSSLYGLILTYNSIIHHGCTQIVTAPDNGKLSGLRLKKFIPNLLAISKETIISEKAYGKELNDINIVFDSADDTSSVIFQQTASDLGAIVSTEGERALVYLLDEYFLHPFSEEVYLSAEGITRQQGVKFGTVILGGNCGTINPTALSRLEAAIHNAESSNMLIHVIPATQGRAGFMTKDGISMENEARHAILQELERYLKAGNMKKYYQAKKENFITISDILTSTSTISMSDDLQDKVLRGREEAYRLNILPCNLKWDPSGIWTDKDSNGKFWIAEEPIKGHIYVAGCDPIPATSPNTDGSDFALAIKDTTTGKYVAYYAERSNDAQKLYARWKTLLVYYKSETFPNGAPCMVERNQMSFLDAITRERGERYLLASDPKSKDPEIKGYHKPPNVNIDEKLNSLIQLHINRYDVPFIRFYSELDIMNKDNADLMDAIKSCEYYCSFYWSHVSDQERPKERKKLVITIDAQGNTHKEWK